MSTESTTDNKTRRVVAEIVLSFDGRSTAPAAVMGNR
jgi:hypothetical protein